MASNFTELKAEIASYTLRGEADMPVASFIAQAESELQPLLKHYEQEKTVTLTSDGVTVTLPADIIEARSISIGDKILKPMSIYGGQLKATEIGYISAGRGIQLVGTDGTNQTVKLTYRARFTPLSNTNVTNWLLTKFPTVYLHASLARAYHWLKDPASVAAEQAALNQALNTVAIDNSSMDAGGNQIQMELGGW